MTMHTQLAQCYMASNWHWHQNVVGIHATLITTLITTYIRLPPTEKPVYLQTRMNLPERDLRCRLGSRASAARGGEDSKAQMLRPNIRFPKVIEVH